MYLLIALNAISQDFIPLRIDSLHSWSWSPGFEGDTSINEVFSGYTYNSDDSLVQRRSLSFQYNSVYGSDTSYSRFNYSYNGDTVYFLSENLDANQIWQSYSRKTTKYSNQLILYSLTEQFEDPIWVNSSLRTFTYNSSEQETLELLQHWENGSWTNFYKKELIYDPNGYPMKESEYYAEDTGEWDYSRGNLFEYDLMGHKVEEIRINSSINGPYYTGRTNWTYGNDDLLDMIVRCRYHYPDSQNCENIIMATYDYFGQDSLIENKFLWNDDAWEYYGKELTYIGPHIYSNQPDSIVYYDYVESTEDHFPFNRRYLRYEDLGNGKVYFIDETYSYQSSTGEYKLTRLREEWYHVMVTSSVGDMITDVNNLHIFPNPALPGQELNIKDISFGHLKGKILFFNEQGQLVSIQSSNHPVLAPSKSGVYMVMVRDHERVLGIVKQVVAE